MTAERGALPDMARRLSAAGANVKASRAVYDDDLAIRNRLIVEACDTGFSWREVAEWSGVSEARIQQLIVARAGA